MKINLLLFFLLSINITLANDFYWIGDSGNWNNTENWSLESGGESTNMIPSSNDNVIFDNNSFISNQPEITFNSASVTNFTYLSTTASTFNGTTLIVKGDFNLYNNTIFNSTIEFNASDDNTHIINTGGFSQNANVIINSGNWELQNHLITSTNNTISVNCKSFISNGNSIYTDSFTTSSTKLDLSNTSLFTFSSLDLSKAKKQGTNPIIFTNGTSSSNLGKYAGAMTKDQQVICSGGLILDINITADYNGSNVSCNGVCDAEITATVSGTAGPFSYSINGSGFASTFVFSGLCPNFYTIVVTDSSQVLAPGIFATCTSAPELISPAAQITFNPINGQVPIAPTCPGLCDGQAFTISSGGTGTLVTTWPGTGEITANPVGLCSGNNIVIITDDNGCTHNDVLFLSSVPVITFDVTITPPTCNGDSDAQILISNEAGGNGAPYTYIFNPVPGNGQGSNPATGYGAGFVTISVFDAGAGGGAPLCQQDSIVQIVNPPVLSTTAINPIGVSCFGVCDGEITANPIGGVPPYTFLWFDNATGASTGFTNITPNTFCAGDYFVEVTDASGCVVTSPTVNVSTPNQITVSSQAYPVSCFGVCDGSVDVDALGGTPGYTYNWTTVPAGAGVGATDSLSGLCPGQYQIIVTDANGCTSTPESVDVLDAPALTLALNSTDPTCYDICDGTISAVAGGGAGGFTYAWVPNPPLGQGTANITNLCGGIQYTVTVTDINSCTITDNATLNNPVTYDITTAQTNLLCAGDVNGTITTTVNAGGSGNPYTFVWAPGNPTGQGTSSVTNLGAGIYTLTVSDGVNCDTTLTFNITAPATLTATASVISQASCFGDCDGSGQVVINGGTPVVNISWDDPSNQTTLVANNLCNGNYIVTLTDANGCTATDNIVIIEPNQYDVTVSQTVLSCFGDCAATATVNVISGGSPAYTITWDDPLNQNTFTATALCAGVYNATLSDQNSCDSIFTFTIADPTELTVSINVVDDACFGTCLGNATMTTTGGTGVLTYEWFISATNVPLGINNVNSGNLCPGDYYATATDANGCTTTSAVFTIVELPPIVTSIVSSTTASCGVCDATAEISASGGAGGFTFTWAPAPTVSGQGTPIGVGLCGGVYSVSIVDSDGCTASQGIAINSVALETLVLDSVDVSCFGICDGITNVTFACLEVPCILEWFDNNTGITTGQFGNTANALCAGDYLAVLTNNLGCIVTDSITVVTPPQIIASLTNTTNETCFNACNGTATVTASGGEGNLNYVWNPLPGSGQGTVNAGGLCVGNWDITVVDDSSCFVNIPFVIGGPADITVDNISSTDVSCFGVPDGTVTVLTSGGTGALTYQWFICATNVSVGNGAFVNGLAPGDYYVIVTDANGCTTTSNCVTVNDQNQLTSIINTQNSSCFGFCDGVIDVIANGGNGTYFYQWLDGAQVAIAGQTNDTISNICQGTYFLDITDGNGCSIIVGPIDMTLPSNPWNITSSSTDISCNGICDGTGSVVVIAGNTPPYTYLWDDPLTQNTANANGLCPGVYNVTVFDAGVCDTTLTLTVNDIPAFNTIGLQTDISCFGDCTGDATVNPVGGLVPFTITWSDAQVGNTASNLCVGPITATITDAAGCSLDTTFTITEPVSPLTTNSVFLNNATCGLCNGSATVNVIGGTPPYTYVWNGPFTGQGTNNVTNLCSGIISVDVTDANGCTITETFPLADVNAEVLTVVSTDASCFGICDGTGDVSFTCSDPGCTQEWYDAATGITTGVTTTNIGGLCTGSYYVEVTNASGCISIETINILSPTQIFPNEIVTQITCSGDADATIVVAPTGGSGAGYTYNWNPIPPNGNGTNTASPIGPGLWTITVTDGAGCQDSANVNIVDPPVIVITTILTDVTCAGSCDGTITTTVSGGYGTFTFQWFMNGVAMAGETNSSVSNLCPGNYNIQVTDINGCVQMLPNDIAVSEPFAISGPITSTDVVCNGQCDGTATIIPTGGIAPYVINWYDGTNTLIGQNGLTATNLCPNDYYATITDANNCTFTTATVTILDPALLTFTTTSNDASCFGVCDGDASITLNGGTLPYTYVWLDVLGNPIPGGTNSNVFNLCFDNYTVEGFDANGCSTGIQNIIISGFQQITANTFSNDADCGIANGSASVFANGGNAPYTYQWLDNTQTPIATETNSTILNLFSGIYYVDVTDANGCTETFQVTISDLPTTTLTWDAINHPTCFGSADGSLDVTVTGISLPLSFVWNPGGMITEDISNLIAGNYILQVTDALGCINFYDTTLVDPTEIIITPTTIDSDCNLCNGEISVVLTGGTGVLVPTWNNGAAGSLIQNLCPGVFEITVTDDNGCSVVDQITVNNNSGLLASAVVNAITCNGLCDGVITVSATGGTTPYTFNWLNFNSTNSTESNLCANTYFIEVTDSIGCISPLEVDLLEPAAFTVVDVVTPPDCGVNNGQISVTSSGGSLPHTYLWSTADITPTISNLSAGIYTLTVTDNNGCSQDFTFTLGNIIAPTVVLTPVDLTCAGDCIGQISSVVTGGTPNYTYQWLDNAGSTIAGEVNPTITGLCANTYILEVTDNAGCINYETTVINQPDTVLLNTPFEVDPSCFGDCDGTITINPIGGSQPFTYSWDDPANQTVLNPSALCSGNYNVIITDANGCIANQTGTLIDPPALTVILDSIVDATCVNAEDGGIYITVTGGTPPISIEWTNNSKPDTLFTEDIIGVLPLEYYVSIIDANGCTVLDTFSVDTLLTVLAFAGNDTIICFENNTILNGTSNQLNADYTWYDINGVQISDTSELIIPNQLPGSIDFILMVSFGGCDHTDTITVTTQNQITADAGPDLEMFSIDTEVIGGTPTTNDPNNTFTWVPSVYLNDSTLANPSVVQPDEDTWYMVIVTDSIGCTNFDSVYVEVIPTLVIPNGISPNGDGKNETWQLVFKDDFPDMEVSVFNRWGELLFYDNNGYAIEWDGKFKGEDLPVGTYYYVIDVHHEMYPAPFTGPITIMR